MSETNSRTYKYKAFISYKHETDNRFATALQSALHGFARPHYLSRAMWVFRDKTDLSANPKLWPVIQSALDESEYFILFASPESADSRWVKREIDYWLSLHGGSPDKLLILQTGGELVWDPVAGNFNWGETTALPQALDWNPRAASHENLRDKFTDEPYFFDVRKLKKVPDLSLGNTTFLDLVATIAATLHNRDKSDMIGEDAAHLRRYRRRRNSAVVALSVLLLITSVAFVYANRQRNAAEAAQKETAIALQSETIARQEAQEALRREQLAKQETETALKGETEAREEAEKKRIEADEQRQLAVQQQRIAEERRREAERQSKLAFARELAANATLQSPLDPPLGLRLAMKSIETTPAPTKEAEDAFRTSMASLSNLHAVFRLKHADTFNPLFILFNPLSFVGDVVFSPDGELILISGGDDTPQLWEVKTRRKIAELRGHKAKERQTVIRSALFSPDGTRSATLSNDLTVRLWTREGRLINVIPAGADIYGQMVFSPDSKFIITTGENQLHTPPSDNIDGDRRTPQVWEAATGTHVTALRGHTSAVNLIEFSQNGKYCATISHETALVWRTDEWQVVATFKDIKGEDPLDFSPDGRFVVVLAEEEKPGQEYKLGDRTPTVYETTGWSEVAPLKSHEDVIEYTSFSPNGKYILTWGQPEVARLWETGAWKEVATLQNLTGGAETLIFSPDSRYIVAGSSYQALGVWEVPTGRFVTGLDAYGPVKFSPNGKMMATAGERTADKSSASLWMVDGWQNIASLRGHQLNTAGVTFSPDSKYFVTTGMDGIAQIWKTEPSPGVVEFKGSSDQMLSSAFSPDGKLILALSDSIQWEGLGSQESTVYVWDAQTGRRLHAFKAEHPKGYHPIFKAAAFGSDSKRVYAVNERNTLYVWNTETGQLIEVKDEVVRSDVPGLLLSSDATYYMSSNGLLVLDVGIGKTIAELQEAALSVLEHSLPPPPHGRRDEQLARYRQREGAVLSPDGQQLLIHYQTGAQVWDIATRKQLHTLPAYGERVLHAAYSRDGQLIATAGVQAIWIWDALTGQLLRALSLSKTNPKSMKESGPRVFLGYKDFGINSIGFSPDSESLVVTSSDKTSRVVEWRTGRQVAVLSGYGSEPENAIFSRDGRHILTTSTDGVARLYPWEMYAPMEELIELAPTRASRALTAAEMDQYLHVRPKLPWPTQTHSSKLDERAGAKKPDTGTP